MQTVTSEKRNVEGQNTEAKNSLGVPSHRLVVAFIDRIIPIHKRDDVQEVLEGKKASAVGCVFWSTLWMIFMVIRQLWPAFNFPLFLTEAAALAVAFTDKVWGQQSVVAVTAALTGLLLCDSYFYQTRRPAFYRGLDAAAALVFMVVIEIYETVASPSIALSLPVLARGTATALLMLSMVRVLFYAPRSYEPFVTGSPVLTYCMTWLWVGAAFTTMITYQEYVPRLFPHQEFPMINLTATSFLIAFRLQKNALERHWSETTIFQDTEKAKLDRWLYWTWSLPDAKADESRLHILWEVLGFFFLAVPMILTVICWLVRYTPASEIDWPQWAANSGAVIGLAMLWPLIRKANLKLAHAILKRKQARKRGLGL